MGPDQEDPSAESTETTTDAAESTSEAPVFDPSTLPPEAQAYLKSQTEAAKFKAREGARKAAAEEAAAAERLRMAKQLGLVDADEAPSPEEVADLVSSAEATAFRSGVESHLYRIGSKSGVDVDACLDSKGFEEDLIDALDDIDGITDMAPRSKEFKAAVEQAFAAALEKNPRFKPAEGRTGPRPDLSQGARGAGPDVDSRIATAKAKGDWMTVIALENQKLAKIQN